MLNAVSITKECQLLLDELYLIPSNDQNKIRHLICNHLRDTVFGESSNPMEIFIFANSCHTLLHVESVYMYIYFCNLMF